MVDWFQRRIWFVEKRPDFRRNLQNKKHSNIKIPIIQKKNKFTSIRAHTHVYFEQAQLKSFQIMMSKTCNTKMKIYNENPHDRITEQPKQSKQTAGVYEI